LLIGSSATGAASLAASSALLSAVAVAWPRREDDQARPPATPASIRNGRAGMPGSNARDNIRNDDRPSARG